MTTNTTTTKNPKRMTGTVVSNKTDKTVVVLVKRYVKHPKYGKFFKVSKRYQVHDPKNQYVEGDSVSIVECRPISKHKTYQVEYAAA